MIRVEQFQPGDLALLVPQAAQSGYADTGQATGEHLAMAGPAFTAWQDGVPVLTAGFLILQPHHARCWCRLAQIDGCTLAALSKRTRAVIDLAATDYPRIDMEVHTPFEAGHRWARMLGFVREGTMRGYGPNGEDFDLYARVRGNGHG